MTCYLFRRLLNVMINDILYRTFARSKVEIEFFDFHRIYDDEQNYMKRLSFF